MGRKRRQGAQKVPKRCPKVELVTPFWSHFCDIFDDFSVSVLGCFCGVPAEGVFPALGHFWAHLGALGLTFWILFAGRWDL